LPSVGSDDTSGGRPAGPVVLRIKLRYDDLDTMVQRFAPNVGRSGLFLPTRAIQPLGAEVKFELRLANDTPVLVGLGRVKQVRPPDPDHPRAPFGMSIELMRVTRESREVIIRMIERRRAVGLADVGIPMPEDVEAAKRADVEATTPRAETSGIVRDAMAQFASAPVSEQLLTSPRRDSGPLAIATAQSFAPLAPEAARAHRLKPSELIAKVTESGPVDAGGFVAIEGLDDAKLDLGKVLARARALAAAAGGEDLDAELAALQDNAAAPIEIGVEAASAELARQLGGTPVRRERSGASGWAPPPAITLVMPPVAEPAAEGEAATATATAAAAAADVSAPDAASTEVEHVEEPRAGFAPDTVIATEPSSRLKALVIAEHDHDDDEDAEELDDADLVPADEHTEIGDIPVGPAFGAELADQLEAHLAAAEAEADAELADGMQEVPVQAADAPGADGRYSDGQYSDVQQPDVQQPDVQQPDVHQPDVQQPDGQQPDGQYADGQYAEGPYADGPYADGQYADGQYADGQYADGQYADGQPADGQPADVPQPDVHQPDVQYADGAGVPEAEIEQEISDLDVLAEADADDADLLGADGEADAGDVLPEVQAVQPPVDDFASRLDLDDEDRAPVFGERHAVPDPLQYDPPSGGYTLAEQYPQSGIEFDEPHAFANEPGQQAQVAEPADYELENALEALDVDMEDIGGLQESSRPVALPGLPARRPRTEAPTARGGRLPSTGSARVVEPQRASPSSPIPLSTVRGVHAASRAPERPRRAATEDDGVLIDFDDDE
jgi:hypothetical protein